MQEKLPRKLKKKLKKWGLYTKRQTVASGNSLREIFILDNLCRHSFVVKDQYWSTCIYCGMVKPNFHF